jgi:hypothetical protein
MAWRRSQISDKVQYHSASSGSCKQKALVAQGKVNRLNASGLNVGDGRVGLLLLIDEVTIRFSVITQPA